MKISAVDLLSIMGEAEKVATSSLQNEDKIAVLDDLDFGLPPEQFCAGFTKTRAIVRSKIQELMNGIEATQTKSEKPIKSRARKTPTKSTKK